MKKIALITDGWGRYVTYTWIQGYRNYMAAHQSDMDLYIFQSFGNFSMDEKHNAGEYNIVRLPDFSVTGITVSLSSGLTSFASIKFPFLSMVTSICAVTVVWNGGRRT